VHLSDIHLDLEYKVGANPDCGDFLCCRDTTGGFKMLESGAAVWGDYECDTPEKTLDNLLDYVVNEVKPDAIFWTGDNSAHNVWDNTDEEVTNYTIKSTQMIKEKLEGTDITVFPIHGNHDTWPVDIEDFSEAAKGKNYEFNHFKQYWADWLDEDAMNKYSEYGYYSMDFKLKNGTKLPEGSKLIAYNTQTCDSHNWYLLSDRHDPAHQYEWLEQELLSVEKAGGVAVLLGHYTPRDCMT
jgi:sphingomyelin phosphodiesterase